MQIKIRIRTPPGQAKGTEQKVRPFLLGRKTKSATYTNEADDEILWEIDAPPKDIIRIQRNVATYSTLIKSIFEHKLLQSKLNRCDPEEIKQLKDMLQNQTTVEIIKEATAQELIETNKTFWTKLKEKFRKEELPP